MKKHYYTIGEVGNLLGVKPYVIRYWESEFHQLRPRKDEGRIRKYSEDNILLLKKIKDMLYTQKYTIEGARQKLKTEKKAAKPYTGHRKDEQLEIILEEPAPKALSPQMTRGLKEIRCLLNKIKLECQTLSRR